MVILIALLTIALFTAAFFYITEPLITLTARPVAPVPVEEESELDRVYSTLNELEFDRRTGKLSAEDYLRFSTHYKRSAAALLKEKERRMIGEGDATTRDPREPPAEDLDARRKRAELEIDRAIRTEIERRKKGKAQ